MIKRTECVTYKEYLYCDACNSPMTWNGELIGHGSPRYAHDCDGCGIRIVLKEVFPRIIYAERNDEPARN